MSDGFAEGELIISVGGAMSVATDAILAQAQILHRLRGDAWNWAGIAYRARNLDPMRPNDWRQEDPWPDLLRVAGRSKLLAERCSEISGSLMAVARNYDYAERINQEIVLMQAANLAHFTGRLLRAGLSSLWSSPLGATVIGLLGMELVRRRGIITNATVQEANDPDTGSHNNLKSLTNPSTVSLVRALVSSIDDLVAGAAGIPRSVGRAFGDEGLGLIGVSSTAVGVLAAARSQGLFKESPVTVARTGMPRDARPPRGVADMAARIPKAIEGKPQVRIEKYGSDAHPSWAVYVSGTVEWEPAATNEPWDLTANVAAMAGENAGSFKAVMEAMHDAGISSEDPVVISGHSQGGLVATQVAASGAFAVQAVATFGAPESKVPVPPSVATLTVEHTDDVVTAMGGDSLLDFDDRTLVRREAFAGKEPPPDTALPAHHLDTYRETAKMIDASPEEHLTVFRSTVARILGSQEGEAVSWRGTRIPERQVGGGGGGGGGV